MHRIHQGTSGRRCQAPAHSDGFQTVSSALTAVAAAISPSPCCRPDLDPTSKLAAARALSPDTAASSLGDVLGLGEVDEDELYTALDWLLERQPAIEATLAKRHLTHGTLVLNDVSSSYMEGRRRPVAIEVFDGNTADPMTLASQVDKLKQRFHLDHVVLVGDRGIITQARITEDIKSAGLHWMGARRRSRGCWRAARCSFRCSTSATSPASQPPSFPTSVVRKIADVAIAVLTTLPAIAVPCVARDGF